MDRIQYILSDRSLQIEFIYPYLNVYSFKIFEKLIVINVNDILWIRLDDIETYFGNNAMNLIEFTLNIDSNHIKYLNQLHDIPFWDTNTDIYIHELEFQILMIYSGIANLIESYDFLHVIKMHKTNKIIKNNLLKNNLINVINLHYKYALELDANYNYIITQYNNRFTIKCLETDNILIFFNDINQNILNEIKI